MKTYMSMITLIGATFAASLASAQTPGSILGFAGQVNGSVTVSSLASGGCPTRVCTTNLVTSTHCYTNTCWRLVCTTNTSGQIQCTNVPMIVTRCYTNTWPRITCTNVVLSPTSITAHQTLSGALTETAGCDELGALFPTNAVFQAALVVTVRTNDWAGAQSGYFKILSGTNVLASGQMTGVSGVNTLAGSPCGACNHFEGTLRGSVLANGPLRGARLTASYAGDLGGVTCPSKNIPQGSVVMSIDGVGVIPCSSAFTPCSNF